MLCNSDEININDEASVIETIVVGFDFNQVNFDEDMIVFAVNRRIVNFAYPTNGVKNERFNTYGRYALGFWPIVTLSKEYYHNTVFFYVTERLHISPWLRHTVFDCITRLEE